MLFLPLADVYLTENRHLEKQVRGAFKSISTVGLVFCLLRGGTPCLDQSCSGFDFLFSAVQVSGPGCWVGQLASRRQSPQAGADSSEEGDLIKGEKFKERTFVVYDVDLWPEVTAYRLTAV